MPTITIGDYLKDENVIYQVVLSKNKQPMLKEVLIYRAETKNWSTGSLLAFNLSFFKKLIPKVPKITPQQYEEYKSNAA